MAGAIPLLGQNETGIAKFLRCPICFEFPKDKVFLCRKGHSFCSACYQIGPDCPLCRCPLDQDEPIRNFSLEGILDNFVEVDCPYKVNGCGQLPKRGLVQAHQSKCYFNFEKFGKLINVCKLIGYKDCDFQFNNGSTEDAVKHYASAHGCVLVSANHFQMELASLQEVTEVGFNDCFWTPIISDLKNCFLLTFAILNRKDGLTCVSLMLPKLNESCQALIMQYSFNVNTEGEESLTCGFLRSCIDLRKVESLLPNHLPCAFFPKSHLTDGSLLIDCLVQGLQISNETDKVKPERIACSKIATSSEVSSPAGKGKQIECHGMRTCSKVVKKRSEILVTNLPDNPDLLSIVNVFAQFGEIISFEKLENVSIPGEKKCEGVVKTLIIRFADSSSVETLLTKKRICMRHNGKRHCLNVTTTDNVNVLDIELKDDHSINTTAEATTFIDEAQKACLLSRDALKEYVLAAFSKTGDPAVLKYLKKMMSIMAAEFGSLESMKLCIENGINVNLVHYEPAKRSMSLLCYALKDDDTKVGFEKVKLLVENGADVHFKNTSGFSLLHLSVYWGSVEAVKLFLEKGLKVTACNSNSAGWTPLHAAFIFRNVECLAEKVKLLLDYGADVNVKDKYGKSAINYVKDFHSEEIQEIFRNHLHTLPNTTVEN